MPEPPPKSEGSDDDKTLLGKEGEKKDDKPTGAPEKYEDFKLPEGVALNEASLGEAHTLFKELDLSQEAAQKLVDFHVKAFNEAEEGPYKHWADTQTAWRKEVAKDVNLGPRLSEIKTNYDNMLNSVNDPALVTAFKEMVEFTGAGNNPTFIRMIDKLSQSFASAKPVIPGKPAPVAEPGKATGTGANAMYPNLP